MRPVEFITKEGDEYFTSHSGLALIGALVSFEREWRMSDNLCK